MDLQLLETISSFGTAAATIALVILLYRTIKQMEATVYLSKVQTEYRFRPWIGPNGRITELSPNYDGKHQFEVKLKNFGEIPAEYVHAYFLQDEKIMSKDNLQLEKMEKFNLGPMLPNMEKHYWFFIDPDVMEKAKQVEKKIFTMIYFEYPVSGGKSGYGMISEFVPKTNGFVHKDMWVETPSGRTTHV